MSDLIDRQALKDYVNSLSTHPLNEWDTWGVLAAIDKQPTINVTRWHRVEEPPKEYGNYLAVVNGEVMEVTYSDISMRDDWNWSTCDAEGFVWIRSESVTHWMPLPEPPKEDEHGN